MNKNIVPNAGGNSLSICGNPQPAQAVNTGGAPPIAQAVNTCGNSPNQNPSAIGGNPPQQPVITFQRRHMFNGVLNFVDKLQKSINDKGCIKVYKDYSVDGVTHL